MLEKETLSIWDTAVSKTLVTEGAFRETLYSLLVTILLRNVDNYFPVYAQ